MRQKMKVIASVAGALFLLGILAFFTTSCQGDKGPPPDLIIWTGFTDQEYIAIKKIQDKFNLEKKKNIQVVKVPFQELKIKFQVAAPAGQGPDLITGPQDWIGAFSTADLITPLEDSEFTQEQKKIYNPVGVQVMTYDGKTYGLPISLETIAIIYNKDLTDREPQTMEELVQSAAAYNNPKEGKYGFFYELGNFYFSWAFFNGYGTKIFGEKDGKLDINQILLDSPETLQTFEFLKNLRNKYKLIPDGATTDMMNGVFFEQKMIYSLNGNWALGELRKKDIKFDILPLPPLENGRRPGPFVGVYGLLMNKMCKNRPLAVEFMHFMNRPDNQKMFCLASGRIPSRQDTLELIKDQEAIIKFAKAAEYGTPMPNHPAMEQVWEPMGEALKLVVIDGEDPEKVMKIQVQRIKDNIKIMME